MKLSSTFQPSSLVVFECFLIQKCCGLGLAGMPCGEILFRGASKHKSEDYGERIDISEGCHILNTDFFSSLTHTK